MNVFKNIENVLILLNSYLYCTKSHAEDVSKRFAQSERNNQMGPQITFSCVVADELLVLLWQLPHSSCKQILGN